MFASVALATSFIGCGGSAPIEEGPEGGGDDVTTSNGGGGRARRSPRRRDAARAPADAALL